MCLHDNVVEAGVEPFSYWTEGDLYTTVEFQQVRCQDCKRTFLVDDLLDLG
jgi:transposase-like protein